MPSKVNTNSLEQEEIIGHEKDRLFLVVVDNSEELSGTIKYTCNRARHTGGKMALLYVIDMEHDKEFQHRQFVSNLMEEEAMQLAQDVLDHHARQIFKDSGSEPIQFIRRGNTREELFALVRKHPEISILVLGSAAGEKPGPLVEAVTGKYAGQLGIPVTIVPGELSSEEINRLT